MTFLNPVMLLGLAAVAVPIVIHLLKRRRLQKVVWAAMRFLSASVEQHRRRMKVEDLILLAVRCLLIALLALALARPAMLSSGGGTGGSRVTAIIVIDNSRSMGMSDGTSTRLDKARKAAEQVLDTLPSGSSVAVWFASDLVQAAIAEPSFDFNLARKVIRTAPQTDRASNLAPLFQKARETLRQTVVAARELYLITDGQALAWQQWTEIQKALESIRGSVNTHIVLINEHETRNLAITELTLTSGLSPARHPSRFQVTVANEGNTAAENLRVGIGLDGQPALDEFVIPHLPAGGNHSVSLFPKLPEEGLHSVMARIAEDRLASDDQMALVVHATGELRVLLVKGRPATEERPSSTHFLEHALRPIASDRTNEYFVRVSALSPGELNSIQLDDYDVIILSSVPPLDESAVKRLESFVQRGGGLMIFPGEDTPSIAGSTKLLPAQFGTIRGAAEQDEKSSVFQGRPYEHPVVSLWNDAGVGELSSVRFFKHFELLPSDDGKVVLSYRDGAPAIAEHRYGNGRVMLFSSSADTSWNDWPVRPSFVPFLHRALGAIVQRHDDGLNISVGETFTRQLDAQFLHKDVTFRRAGQQGAVRDLRRVEMLNSEPSVQYNLTDSAGIYSFEIADPPLSAKFSVRGNPGESSLAQISPAQIEMIRNYARISEWTPSFELKSELEGSRAGMEFWLPLVLLGAMLAMSESVLAQWFSRSR